MYVQYGTEILKMQSELTTVRVKKACYGKDDCSGSQFMNVIGKKEEKKVFLSSFSKYFHKQYLIYFCNVPSNLRLKEKPDKSL